MEKNIIIIKRPSGQIEHVDISAKFPFLTKANYEKMIRMNREAGRGDIIGFSSGGIGKEIAVDAGAFGRSRRTMAAILGGSRDENADTSNRAIRGGY